MCARSGAPPVIVDPEDGGKPADEGKMIARGDELTTGHREWSVRQVGTSPPVRIDAAPAVFEAFQASRSGMGMLDVARSPSPSFIVRLVVSGGV
jgi:hypothetical protein